MLSIEGDGRQRKKGEEHHPFKRVFLTGQLLVLIGREVGVLREELGACRLSKKDVTNISQMKLRPKGAEGARTCPLSSTTANRHSAYREGM